MTAYGHHFTARPFLHMTRRLWAALAMLVLAGAVALIVALNSSDTDQAQPAAPRIATVQHEQGPAAPFDCRPTNVVHPC